VRCECLELATRERLEAVDAPGRELDHRLEVDVDVTVRDRCID
jgi:hypothetical protein